MLNSVKPYCCSAQAAQRVSFKGESNCCPAQIVPIKRKTEEATIARLIRFDIGLNLGKLCNKYNIPTDERRKTEINILSGIGNALEGNPVLIGEALKRESEKITNVFEKVSFKDTTEEKAAKSIELIINSELIHLNKNKRPEEEIMLGEISLTEKSLLFHIGNELVQGGDSSKLREALKHESEILEDALTLMKKDRGILRK